MSSNPYAAPTSELNYDENRKGANANANEFYVVSTNKFLILFVMTHGLYLFYWFYRNWNLYRLSSGERLFPAIRAVFAIFFTHSLFRKVNETLENQGISYEWNHHGLASQFVLFLILQRVFGRLSDRGILIVYTFIASYVCFFAAAAVLKSAQVAINVACNDPNGESNNSYGVINAIFILMGAVVWFFLLLGVAMELMDIKA